MSIDFTVSKQLVPEYTTYVERDGKAKKVTLKNQELDVVSRTVSARIMIKEKHLFVKELWDEFEKAVEADEKLGVKIHRKHPAKRLVNRFSGGYMSPTMIKGFFTCPATQVVQSLTPYISNAYTAMGTTIHGILEDFYNLEQGKRTFDALDKITETWIEKGEHNSQLEKTYIYDHIKGFKQMGDYLDPSKPMDHNKLVCFNEYFAKGVYSPLGVELPLPMYNLMDRLDIRDEGIFIIDYKSGKYFREETFSMDGYLPQMIAYKWAVEEEYGEEVKGAYILTPGIENKIHYMDINSLQNQSMFIEKCLKYKEEIDKSNSAKCFPIWNHDYFEKQLKQNNWPHKEMEDGSIMITASFSYEAVIESEMLLKSKETK